MGPGPESAFSNYPAGRRRRLILSDWQHAGRANPATLAPNNPGPPGRQVEERPEVGRKKRPARCQMFSGEPGARPLDLATYRRVRSIMRALGAAGQISGPLASIAARSGSIGAERNDCAQSAGAGQELSSPSCRRRTK